MDMTNLHRSPPMNQSKTDFGIVNESQLLRFGIRRICQSFTILAQLPNLQREVNTPPAKAGGFRLRLKAGLVRPLADSDGGCASSYLEIIVRFGRCLVLDIFGPYLIGNVSAARDPISSAP